MCFSLAKIMAHTPVKNPLVDSAKWEVMYYEAVVGMVVYFDISSFKLC